VAALGPPWPWPEGDSVEALGVRTSMPDWIVTRLVADLGVEDARGALEIANEPAALTLRVNRRRASIERVEADLVASGASVERGRLLGDALIVRGGGDPGRMPAVAEGRATPQDQGSQAVAASVGAIPGDLVCEVGAAPGGKVTAIAEALDDRGLVVAVDSNAGRLELVRQAAARLGLSSVAPVAADGRSLPLQPGGFDRVLVDAPCSGFGVLRRRPEARWRIEASAVDELASLQRQLLERAATMVNPGGRLVYSVCTLTRAESIDVDEWARTALPEFGAEPPPGPPWRPWGRGALLLPQAAGTDGMYVLVLSRRSTRLG
jgi:16S rRNA (cytosine967-C5)-methyltransferase